MAAGIFVITGFNMSSVRCFSLDGHPVSTSVLFPLFPHLCHEVMGLDAVIFIFWMLSFKPILSLSSFTFTQPRSQTRISCIGRWILYPQLLSPRLHIFGGHLLYSNLWCGWVFSSLAWLLPKDGCSCKSFLQHFPIQNWAQDRCWNIFVKLSKTLKGHLNKES